ncbi:dihydrodipicolinate synthase family protein [Methylobacterium persicinum]|uniref:4-hydroxy-tetrahydrodipicolinate synthase n=1 Tax=Methylobacterium persicinum TaxID=374426 RepID=A0ABU0HQY3_9HYPH|nr:dihydrodipicolinate synthase family protein [Methylobacterium persicinum]MDQ0444327.1 4-hydroxy-tetrahydrodipicolinate synthase [Methylobacterium persicinum]GJE36241.1 4-hydroxy-tetrahydrodipicolinate synthase [Methylobacterium persicinum]
MSAFTGLSAFPITPCDAQGRLDADGLRRLLAPLVEAGVDSIGLLGSTGTYAYLTREERRRAVSVAAEAVAGRVPLLVGVGALRTDEAVRLAQDAKAAGAAAGLLAPMSYTPLTEVEVFAHFATVAEEGGLPLVIYDNPATTHFRFTPALLGRIARLPGVAAAKCPGPAAEAAAETVAELRAALPAEAALGFSGDWNATEAMIAGGVAWYSVAAGLFPRPCLEIVRAVQAGDAETARRLDGAMAPLWGLFKAHSSLRIVYGLAQSLGLAGVEPPRPILPLPEPVRAQALATVRAMGLV